jgi:small subunit ribosomal protein S4
MARYIRSKTRIVRRLGALPSFTKKTSHKKQSPGEHGTDITRVTSSQYGIRLQEKQKIKFGYGVSAKQLLGYMFQAKRNVISTGYALLQILEMRLDCILYTLECRSTIPACRQLVNHGHVRVNGKIVNIPSYQCVKNDVITIAPKFQVPLKSTPYINVNGMGCEIIKKVNPYDVKSGLELRHIVEFYSRK